MDAFVTRKKRKSSPTLVNDFCEDGDGDESTDFKLTLLSSLHPDLDHEALLDVLLAHDGCVSDASAALSLPQKQPITKSSNPGAQSSLRSFANPLSGNVSSPTPAKKFRLLSKKGKTLFLFDPLDIAQHTPCTVIHNFLAPEEANELLRELLLESETYEKITFKLFDNVVSSPHTSGFYVGSEEELKDQKYEYLYNGARLSDVRRLTPRLEAVKPKVQEAVNREIQHRIATRYPGGKKLRYQCPRPWAPNAAFVNCYNGPQQNVGWHSDQLTYLGPRAVIGSLSLGVAREFRVRRVLPRTEVDLAAGDSSGVKIATQNGVAEEDSLRGDAEGQISIHLPHNSLLVMHAEMQEEWKHSIAPAQAIEPHPIAGNRRINVTYRDYRPEFHPSLTPKCRCGIAAVMRVVQKKKENWGKYFWMCHAGNVPGKDGCSFFQWAEFDDDGNPLLKTQQAPGTTR
ncbi:hypothetical protein MCOR25_000685 [Pyricularia grisea]|uniref:Fe2OG dioxygenase domain-containing protein n=1 Tax=Pyricularia grisea TaxID=148305 RepID=A0A6P8BBJ9_PYRGI|nr:uncharacterized protein PgNI_04027 [Pyricularia grisea]KAI6382386.1 hypothetical protein MCOR25_000685 [Pyricularia grisea]TLD13174.1 hypothetical protein PgNI_04027 [Pyricularia grisea]